MKQLRERFRLRHDSKVKQHFVPETCIQQMEDGMFGSADIEIGYTPILQRFRRCDCLRVPGVEEPQVVPTGAGPPRPWLR
jgi:hypothetical protein